MFNGIYENTESGLEYPDSTNKRIDMQNKQNNFLTSLPEDK